MKTNPTPKQYIRLTKPEKFVANLTTAIEWHRRNHNDPYNTDMPVMIALHDIRHAFAKAHNITIPKSSDK